jgi:hypothetical protein
VHLSQKYRPRFPCSQQYSLSAFQPICPTVPLQPDASLQPLQIPTAVDGEHLGFVKNRTMKNIKNFSHDRGKDEIRQNVEAQFGNGFVSEFAHLVAIMALELISEGIRHLRRKK